MNRLMLVDDDEDDREFFLAAIHEFQLDAECTTAQNGQEALEQLTSASIKPQIIFLDLNMPLMNGMQFLQERQQHKDLLKIPVVVLTTSSDNGARMETISLGARFFVTKPDKLSAWKTILKNIYDDSAVLE